MTKTFKRIIIVGIVFIVIATGAAIFVITGGCSSQSGGALEGVRNDAVNTLIDSSGIKDRIEDELHNRAGEISEQTGIPVAVVDTAIDSLDIKDWEVTSLPATATETGTYAVDTDDVSANVTTYDDPSVVTVDAYGQTVTFSVPESAQTYVALLNYLN